MPARPRIAIDAMGGDGGPAVTIPAAESLSDAFHLIAVGDEAVLSRARTRDTGLSILHAGTVIGPEHTLSEVLRGLPDASMRVALRLLAEGEVDAVVSAGDTGALMALGRLELGMIEGISRPAIVKGLRGVHREFWMLDVGANLECTADLLVQFARMGSDLARCTGGLERPTVGLLNIGTEPDKGPDALQLAAGRLEADPDIDYRGFIEGQRLFQNDVDVVVCDGFAGNVALKSIEGAALMAGHLLAAARAEKGAIAGKLMDWLGGVPEASQLFDPQQYNGASLIGLDGVVVKSHGAANETGVAGAIREAAREVHGGVRAALAESFRTTTPRR